MRAGPFLLFASREQRKCRKERTITKPLRQGSTSTWADASNCAAYSSASVKSDLARKIGPVAFQQVQKYENGTDRVSASRLYLIAEAFGVGIGFFYGLDDAAAGIDTAAVAGSIGLLGRAVRDRGECFRDMTPEQRSTCARRDAPGALLGAVLADCSAASGLFDDLVGQKPAIR